MFRIESEKVFLKAFRPRDRKFVEVPKGLKFPLVMRDYVSWVDPYGVRVFVLFQPVGATKPVGIAFRRDQQASKTNPSGMCDWCHSWGSGEEVGLLTTDVNSKKRVGVNACLDLRCKEKTEDSANRAGLSVLAESKKLVERMSKFAADGLGITDAVQEDAVEA